MRPRGQIRQALGDAAQRLVQQRQQQGVAVAGVTWRELAESAQVGYQVARRTVCEMRRAGELAALQGAQVRMPHARRPLQLYVPVALPAGGQAGPGQAGAERGDAAAASRAARALDGALRAWVGAG